MRSSARVLLDCNQGRNTTAFPIDAPQKVARTLGRDHDHVHVCRRNDRFEMNAETVGEAENLSFFQSWLDGRLVERCLGLIRSKNLDPIRLVGRFRRSQHSKAIGLRLLRALAGRVKPDNYVVTAVAQVLGLGVSLAAVAEDGDSFALQGCWIGVVFVEDGCHNYSPIKGHTDRSVGVREWY